MIFLVKLAIRKRLLKTVSQNGSKLVPSAITSSTYSEQAFAETVVRKLASALSDALIKPFFKPNRKVSVNLSCASPLIMPRTR